MSVAPRLQSAQRNVCAAVIGRAAVRALYTEVALYPKPGLVSPHDSGAHDDMSMATFLRSLCALRGFFRDIAAAGAREAPFWQLQALGVAAEARMLTATGGINTHRGAIFTLGLLAAAAGALRTRCGSLAGAALGHYVADQWGSAILVAGLTSPRSNGGDAVRKYRVCGAREEAAHGFPSVFELALPELRRGLATGLTREAAMLQTLFVVMATLDDTNVLHRGGAEGLAFVRSEARAFLNAGGVGAAGALRRVVAFHRACIAQRLSPGGAADILAATLFVHELRRGE